MRARQLGGEAEVRELHGPVLAEQDVLRFEVRVDPARPVEMGEPLADARDQPAAIDLVRPRVDQFPETAGRPLHDQHDRALQRGAVGRGENERLQETDQPGMPGPAPEFDLATGGLHDPARLERRESGGRHDLERDTGPARAAPRRSRRVHRGPAPGADRAGDHPVPDAGPGREQLRAVAVRAVPQGVRRSHRAACRSRPPAPVSGGSSARCSSRTSPNRSASPTISSRLPLRRSPWPGSWVSGPPMRSFSSAR